MVSDAGGHRRRPLHPPRRTASRIAHAQRLVWRAEIIERADEPHPLFERHRAPRQRTCPPNERGEPLPESGVQAFNERRVEDTALVRFVAQALDLLGVTILDPPLDCDDRVEPHSV